MEGRTGRLERYAHALERELAQKDLSRLPERPAEELVLLIEDSSGAKLRLVIRMGDGVITLCDEASNRYLPQAILKTQLDAWTELLRSGRIDPERVDLYGEPAVLTHFLAVHALAHRPLELRCAMMVTRKNHSRRPRAANPERNAS